MANDYDSIQKNGFFAGYDSLVWTVVLLAALGGLVVAVVVKFADNVLKGFAASASIVLSCVISSMVFHDSQMTLSFMIGASIVCGSAYAYSYSPPQNKDGNSSNSNGGGVMSSNDKLGLENSPLLSDEDENK